MESMSPAAERNKQPIAEILLPLLNKHQWLRVVEIGSRFAQHAIHFQSLMPELTWQTSDIPEHLADLQTSLDKHPISGPEALPLNVSEPSHWKAVIHFAPQVMFTANTFHIMPWASVMDFWKQLVNVRTLEAVVVYGPFFDATVETASSNLDFDQSLKQRIPGAGLRQLSEVTDLAHSAGFELQDAHFMPANNRLLVFVKTPTEA